jgi:hypothetical protein
MHYQRQLGGHPPDLRYGPPPPRGDAEARVEYTANSSYRGLEWTSTFRNYTHSEARFSALLTEGDVRVTFNWLHKTLT